MLKESDWKLLSLKYYEWKNRYLVQFITEYKAILDSDDTPIDKFVELKERINKDSRASVFHLPGRFSRNDMNLNIKSLLDTGVITIDDLSEFSDEVRDMAEFVVQNNNY